MKKIRCICIDNKDKPNEIPQNLWIENEKEYHITWIWYHYSQGLQGVELGEVQMDNSCKPYESYRLNRFAIAIEDLSLFFEMLKECTELTDIEARKYVDELLEKGDLVLTENDEEDSSEDWKKLIKNKTL